MSNNFANFEKYLTDCAKAVDQELEKYLDFPEDAELKNFLEAVRYSVFSGGKRVRPFLLIAISDLLGVPRSQSIKYSAIIELIHAYSLVHDDLPAIDNDEFRRGKESCWKKYGEALAILVGDALLNRAFEVLAMDDDNIKHSIKIKCMQSLSSATSIKGLIGGQVLDINTRFSSDRRSEGIDRVNGMKTGSLFNICAEIPCILSETQFADKLKPRLLMYVKSTSAAFQIADDIDDMESDKKRGNEGGNMACIIGVEKAKQEIEALTNQAVLMIESVDPEKTKVLVEFAKYVHAKIL